MDGRIGDWEELVYKMLEAIGDDPDRPGLIETPSRVVRSWLELFGGYGENVPALFKVFEDAEKYDEFVLMRNVEFYSFCEHHILPFTGVAHVAYIPGYSGKVVGASKLARIVDAFARRLQMQERIGQQVVQAIEDNLKPKGAACIIEARHLCMSCRGVGKQRSDMVTSSLSGAFKENTAARLELMTLIKGGVL